MNERRPPASPELPPHSFIAWTGRCWATSSTAPASTAVWSARDAVPRALVVGSGAVGSAIAALAAAGLVAFALYDANPNAADALVTRLRSHDPALHRTTGSSDPAGFDIAVNGMPPGMYAGN